jgi:hypothetical protein
MTFWYKHKLEKYWGLRFNFKGRWVNEVRGGKKYMIIEELFTVFIIDIKAN